MIFLRKLFDIELSILQNLLFIDGNFTFGVDILERYIIIIHIITYPVHPALRIFEEPLLCLSHFFQLPALLQLFCLIQNLVGDKL